MNINGLIQTISSSINAVRGFLIPIPALFMVCTTARRPGFSSILASAKVYADMYQNENDDIVKKFVYNVVDKIKRNIQDDGVCFIAIPPGELKFILTGGNEGGPIVFTEDPKDSSQNPSNQNFTFMWGIIK